MRKRFVYLLHWEMLGLGRDTVTGGKFEHGLHSDGSKGSSKVSISVVEDNSQGMALTCLHLTHTVSHVNAISPARCANRPMVNGKRHGIALPKRNHRGPRLHPWTLLCQHELAALEIMVGLRQQDRNLEGEDVLPVEVLMQAVVVTRDVSQEKRRRACLSGIVTALQEGPMAARVPDLDTHGLVPPISGLREFGIKGSAQP